MVMEVTRQRLIYESKGRCSRRDGTRKLGFLRQYRRYLVVIYKMYVRPLLKYNSHVWAILRYSLILLTEFIDGNPFHFIDDATVFERIDTLELRCSIRTASLFHHYFSGWCSADISPSKNFFGIFDALTTLIAWRLTLRSA